MAGKVKAAWAVENGVAEAVMKMSFGNQIGFQAGVSEVDWYAAMPGAIVAELTEEVDCAVRLGETTEAPFIALPGEAVSVAELFELNHNVLEKVYPTQAGTKENVPAISWDKRSIAVCKHKVAQPKAVIPVFPGTNCEYDTAKACVRAGIEPEIVVVRNLTTDFLAQSAQALEKAIRSAQMVVIPGGFSGGDEPEGSGKFIASFLRNPALSDAIMDLLKNRDGLMMGICNGFQALVKLGLVPYGEIRPMDDNCPTLTYNLIGRHQSSYVTTRVASVQSPWMLKSNVGDLHTIPISHGEGRFVGPQAVIDSLIAASKTSHIERLQAGRCTIQTGFVLSDILNNYSRVSDHCSNIAVALIETTQGSFETHEYLNEVKTGSSQSFQERYQHYLEKYPFPAR